VFKELKERFIKELVLVAPDLDKKMRMEVDTSDYVTVKVLLWNTLNTNIFLFLLSIFLDFIFLFF